MKSTQVPSFKQPPGVLTPATKALQLFSSSTTSSVIASSPVSPKEALRSAKSSPVVRESLLRPSSSPSSSKRSPIAPSKSKSKLRESWFLVDRPRTGLKRG